MHSGELGQESLKELNLNSVARDSGIAEPSVDRRCDPRERTSDPYVFVGKTVRHMARVGSPSLPPSLSRPLVSFCVHPPGWLMAGWLTGWDAGRNQSGPRLIGAKRCQMAKFEFWAATAAGKTT